MSAKRFSIIGDGNIRRNMTGLNVASRESMQTAQVIDYLGVSPINEAFSEIRTESNVLIFAAVTEMLISNGDCGTIFASIDPALNSLYTTLSSFCTSHPDIQVR